MRYLIPKSMEEPVEIYTEDLITLLLDSRPHYVVLFDTDYHKIEYIRSKVYVVEYLPVRNDCLYYFNSKIYAKQAAKVLGVDTLIQITSDEEMKQALPVAEDNVYFKFYAPGITDTPVEIDLHEFIPLMLRNRPPYCVVWNLPLRDLHYVATRVYVVSYMPVIDNVLYFPHSKHYALLMKKKFNFKKIQKYNLETLATGEI